MEETRTSCNSSVHDKDSRITNLKETTTDSVTPPESSTSFIIVGEKKNNAPAQTQQTSLATLQNPRTSTEDPPPAYSEKPAHIPDDQCEVHDHRTSYRGFPSQQAYLAALNEWAETQKYLPVGDNGVTGFYGETTLEEHGRREPKVEMGLGRL
ncbi:hypothetical protein D0861_01473 [Hortaea werneckii]|uniref:Uncharacterized protein n=1 Tax=Hortaea werneckii TaxID=91943 RepID=A0A3M7FZB1_HORWE|nr:hypothetical protein D0861_01473 [Hortaea werneckii]